MTSRNVNQSATSVEQTPPSRPSGRRLFQLLVLVATLAGLCFWLSRPSTQAPPHSASHRSQHDASPNPIRDEAMQLADQVLLDFPNGPEGLYIRGLIVSRFGDSREAVRCWRECLAMVPEFADPHFWIGWDAMRRGEYDQAITEFQQALELQPELPDVRLRLGESLIHAGRLREAIDILKQQIQFEPNRYEGHFRLGEAYFHNEQIPEAIVAYKQATKLDPDNTFAWFGLSKSYRRLGQTEQAQEYLKQFQSRKAKQTELARSEKVAYDDLSELRTGLANAYFAAARVYDLANRPDRAKACLEKSIALDPTNDTYRRF